MQSQADHITAINKNYYQVMDVQPSATPNEISKAFKKLALKWHPDRHSEFQKSFAHRRFIDLVEAYEVLGTPARRIRYDAYREYKQFYRSKPHPASSGRASVMTGHAKQNPSKADVLFEMSLKFDKELQKWCKKADSRARELAKISYLQFAASIDVITKLVVEGIFNALDIIAGKKQHRKALNAYKKSLEEFPNDASLHFRIGFLHHQNRDHEKAEKYYLKSLRLNPKSADVFCNLGRLREELDNFKRAVRCYERAVELNPDLHIVYAYLGILHLKMEQYTEAKNCFDFLIDKGREDLAIQIERAFLQRFKKFTCNGPQ